MAQVLKVVILQASMEAYKLAKRHRLQRQIECMVVGKRNKVMVRQHPAARRSLVMEEKQLTCSVEVLHGL